MTSSSNARLTTGHSMKTFNEYIDDDLQENVLRSVSAVAITAKVNTLYNQILSIKHSHFDKDDLTTDKLFRKIDLLAQQNRNLAVLVAGLDLTQRSSK